MKELRDGMNKTNWIFLRGLTRGNIHWGDFESIFKKHCPNSNLEFLELPGNGTLNLEQTPTNPIEVIKILIAKSKIYSKYDSINLCGISLGGMIALKWSELYPEKFSSVNVINTSLNQFSPFYKRLLPNNYTKILINLILKNEEKNEFFILKTTSNKFQTTKKHLKKFSTFAKVHKITTQNILKQLILANKIKISNPPLVPLKIICSKNDRLVHFSCSEIISKKYQGIFFIHPSAGHDLPLDEPDWLIQKLLY